MSSSRKYLLICPVGRADSAHRQWLKAGRSYDVLLANYSTTRGLYAGDADLYHEGEGFKLEMISGAIAAHPGLLSRYEAVWLPDDDLAISSDDVDRLFQLFAEYELMLAQPAISNLNASHPETLRRYYSVLRYGNRVEMMCPLFRADHLAHVLPTFMLNRSGWGVEWLWSRGLPSNKVAVIDSVSVRHLKTIERDGPYYRKLASLGVDSLQEEQEIIEQHGLTAVYCEAGVVFRPAWEWLAACRPVLECSVLCPFYLLGASRPLRQRIGLRRRRRT